MDYNALLDANVSMFDFLNALSTELDVSAGTYSDVLGADATVGDVLDAVAAVSQQSGNDAAAAAARLLKSQSNAASLAVPLSQMIARGSMPSSARRGTRPVYFDGKAVKTPAYARSELKAGNRIAGPALIEEHASTTVLMPGDRMQVDGYGNLVIEVGKKR